MDYATLASALLATPFALTLLPLTVRLLPVIHQIGKLVSDFTAADPEPLSCYYFETQLQALLREVGRIIIEWVYNRLEPDDRLLMPNHLRFDGDWYRCRDKTANRNVATLFGTITLWRYLYQPIHGVERSIFPLEIRLGLVAGRATPALAERVAHAAADSTQETVRAELKRDQGVAGGTQAGAGRRTRWGVRADPRRGLLSRGRHGYPLGPGPRRPAAGHGVLGSDARTWAETTVGSVD